jgi:kynurenine formamidase
VSYVACSTGDRDLSVQIVARDNLGELPAQGFTFHAVPVKVQGVAAFPVRAYAVIYD